MSFLSTQMSNRLANPGLFEAQIKEYFRKSNNVIQQSKTIADRICTDAKYAGGTDEVELFTGVFNANYCNLDGNYVRPASEHIIIYGIQVYTAIPETKEEFDNGTIIWNKGFTTTANPLAGGALTQDTGAPYIDVSLTTNGVQYLQEVTGGDFDSNLATNSKGTLWLNLPVIWSGQTSLSLQFNTGNGADFNVEYAIRADLIGIGLI